MRCRLGWMDGIAAQLRLGLYRRKIDDFAGFCFSKAASLDEVELFGGTIFVAGNGASVN
jgi:hypothetical protein